MTFSCPCSCLVKIVTLLWAKGEPGKFPHKCIKICILSHTLKIKRYLLKPLPSLTNCNFQQVSASIFSPLIFSNTWKPALQAFKSVFQGKHIWNRKKIWLLPNINVDHIMALMEKICYNSSTPIWAAASANELGKWSPRTESENRSLPTSGRLFREAWCRSVDITIQRLKNQTALTVSVPRAIASSLIIFS